jgi:RHS repeat-associated protein
MKIPGGGETTFRPRGYEDEHNDNYFEIHPAGTIQQARYGETIEGVPKCPTTDVPAVTAGVNYYAVDGSSTRLFVPYNAGSHWFLYYPDGTVVENAPPDDTAIEQRITDRNGNRVEITTDVYDGVVGVKIIDDVGRFIFYSPENGSAYQFGVNGEELKTKITRKSVWVYRNYKTTDIIDPIVPPGKRYSNVIQQFSMVEKIELPAQIGNGNLSYRFTYHADDRNNSRSDPPNYTDGWGEIASVELPSKAKSEYTFDLPGNQSPFDTTIEVIGNKVTKKELSYHVRHDGVSKSETETWFYDIGYAGTNSLGPSGAASRQNHYGKSPYLDDTGKDWRAGLVHTVTNPDGSKISRVWKQQDDARTLRSSAVNPYIASEETVIPFANGQPYLKSKREFKYDQNNNLLEVLDYGYIPVGSDNYPLLKKTINTYYNPTVPMGGPSTDQNHYSNPNSPGLLKLIKSSEIQDGDGNMASRTEYVYDNSEIPTVGNLTESRQWDSNKMATLRGADSNGFKLDRSNSISTLTTYDQYGNPLISTDPNGIRNKTEFGAINGYPGLYPTQNESAYGEDVERTSSTQYDFATGVSTVFRDEDNNVETRTVYDVLGRPTLVKTAFGTPSEVWSRTEYDDDNRLVVSRSDVETAGDGMNVSIRHYDQRGRLQLFRRLEDAANQNPYDETHGVKIQTRHRYQDGINPNQSDGQYILRSNPYRAATSVAAEDEETMGWSVRYSNKSGTRSTSENFSGAALPAPWGTNLGSTGKSVTDVTGNSVTRTDAAGRQKRAISNSFGQLIRIDEPNAAGVLGPISSPVQPTSYKYNTVGRMIEVNQGLQKRHFLYDSLGRLIRVRQPEQEVNSALNLSNFETANIHWTAGATHDQNGNVLTATDAENKVITTAYDELNRPLSVSYSDGVTPSIANTYDDSSVAYSKGKLTRVANGISTNETVAFNPVGKAVENIQTTDGVAYRMKYVYNVSGGVIEEEYPSGRKVKNDLDSNGDIARIYGNPTNTAGEKTYAAGFEYTVDQKIQRLRIGNGRWESATFNSNLQATQLALGTSEGNGSLWKLDYQYGELDSNGNADAAKNTGNVAKQTLEFDGLVDAFETTYKYDSISRLSEAEEKSGNRQTWIQTFGYDQYSNRVAFSQNILGNRMPLNNVTLPDIDPGSNRFSEGQGYEFDKIGNLEKDVTSANLREITYDANNKQTGIRDLNTGITLGEYFYDGNGRRVKKKVYDTGGLLVEEIVFVYSGDKLVAEYSTQDPPDDPATNYTLTDTLGSVRVISDQHGRIVSRRDFLPFGEEIQTDPSHRKASLKYGSDDIRQKFTGYQRDDETGLDFAEARMYNSGHARFTVVDPLLASGKFADPQTFNRYTYVSNNPMTYVDPTGLQQAKNAPPKEDFNLEFITFQKTFKTKIDVYQVHPVLGLRIRTIETEEGRTNIVDTNEQINDIANRYSAAVYSNEFVASSATTAVADNAGSVAAQAITFGVTIGANLEGVEGSAQANLTVNVTNVDDITAARDVADNFLSAAAAKEMEGVKTVATGSPKTPRYLSEDEVDGILNAAGKAGRERAKEHIERARGRRKERKKEERIKY